MVLDGAGSVKGGTGWYLMVLGQKRAVLNDSEWYRKGWAAVAARPPTRCDALRVDSTLLAS